MKNTLPLVTRGEILREEFLSPLGLSAYRVAKDIGVSPTAIGQILSCKWGKWGQCANLEF